MADILSPYHQRFFWSNNVSHEKHGEGKIKNIYEDRIVIQFFNPERGHYVELFNFPEEFDRGLTTTDKKFQEMIAEEKKKKIELGLYDTLVYKAKINSPDNYIQGCTYDKYLDIFDEKIINYMLKWKKYRWYSLLNQFEKTYFLMKYWELKSPLFLANVQAKGGKYIELKNIRHPETRLPLPMFMEFETLLEYINPLSIGIDENLDDVYISFVASNEEDTLFQFRGMYNAQPDSAICNTIYFSAGEVYFKHFELVNEMIETYWYATDMKKHEYNMLKKLIESTLLRLDDEDYMDAEELRAGLKEELDNALNGNWSFIYDLTRTLDVSENEQIAIKNQIIANIPKSNQRKSVSSRALISKIEEDSEGYYCMYYNIMQEENGKSIEKRISINQTIIIDAINNIKQKNKINTATETQAETQANDTSKSQKKKKRKNVITPTIYAVLDIYNNPTPSYNTYVRAVFDNEEDAVDYIKNVIDAEQDAYTVEQLIAASAVLSRFTREIPTKFSKDACGNLHEYLKGKVLPKRNLDHITKRFFGDIQTIGEFYVRTDISKCVCNYHKLEDITASIDVKQDNGIIKSIEIPAGYCKTCGTKYIFEREYQKLLHEGTIMCHIVTRTYYNKYGVKDTPYNNASIESDLHAMGYNVNISNNLTASERQKILRKAIESGRYSKIGVESYLESLITRSDGQPRMINAIRKWEEDLQFVMQLAIPENNQPEQVNIIYKNQYLKKTTNLD